MHSTDCQHSTAIQSSMTQALSCNRYCFVGIGGGRESTVERTLLVVHFSYLLSNSVGKNCILNYCTFQSRMSPNVKWGVEECNYGVGS